MIVVCLAYPTPPRGSHKGVPLRCGFGVLREDWQWIPTFVGMTTLCNAPVGAATRACPYVGASLQQT